MAETDRLGDDPASGESDEVQKQFESEVRPDIRDACDKLGLSGECLEKAVEFGRSAYVDYSINHKPSAIVAGSVYLSSLYCMDKRTQAEVSDATGVHETTIGDTYNEMRIQILND